MFYKDDTKQFVLKSVCKKRLFLNHTFLANNDRVLSFINRNYWELVIKYWKKFLFWVIDRIYKWGNKKNGQLNAVKLNS